jgi:endonuclease G
LYDLDSLNQKVFTWQTALSLALGSELAYQPKNSVEFVATRNWGLEGCTFLDRNDTQCFVAHTNSAIYVAFRGTESLNDWLADLDVRPISKPYGHVHRGFAAAYDQVASQLVATIDALQASGKVLHLTGHSLGAAVAAIAACELHGRYPIAGIYTFGQPRLGDRTTVAFFEQNYPHSFHRFVFDDDIVPRVPPGFRHVGKLYHFDANGILKESGLEATGTTSEPPELTPDGFELLKQTAKTIRAESRLAPEPTLESVQDRADRSLEGLLPSVSDHRMSRYLFAVRNQIPRQRGAASEVAALEAVEFSRRGGLESVPVDQRYPVQVRARDRDWAPPPGVVVNSKIGPIFSIQATLADIAQMESDLGVALLNVAREMDLPSVKEVATSVRFVGAEAIRGGTFVAKEAGDNAIVALIDSGVDVLHEAFLDGKGKTRIEAIWVQNDASGNTPHETDANIYMQKYGTLYLHAEIQAFIDNPATTPGLLRDPGPTAAIDYGHGTHVASIAAGRAAGTFGGGMAPEARIVVVVPHMKTTPPDPPSLGYSNSHQDALAFLMAFKRSRGLPMAVNVSLGMNAGAHDGMSTLEKAFDSISMKGKEEGFVIVKSAGNERGYSGHARVQAAAGGSVDVEWHSRDVDRTEDYLEFWYSTDDELKFTLVDPAGNRSPTITHSSPHGSFSSAGNNIYLDLTVHHPDNDDNLLVVRVMKESKRIQQKTWHLVIEGVSLGTANGTVDAWMERSDARPIAFTVGVEEDMTLSIPGTADTVISVAASGTSNPMTLTSRSSYGPTRKNGPKPDLNAPGEEIFAARSNSVDHQAVIALSGSSMAAPHVTGAMALVLSARHKVGQVDHSKRQFNAINLAGLVKRTCENYNKLHHKGYGYGRLNALRFFDEAERWDD